MNTPNTKLFIKKRDTDTRMKDQYKLSTALCVRNQEASIGHRVFTPKEAAK